MLKVYQFVASYFIKLGTMFIIWKVPPVNRWNGKQNIRFKNKIFWQWYQCEQINRNTFEV